MNFKYCFKIDLHYSLSIYAAFCRLVPSTLCSVHCRSNCDSSAANVLRQHYQRPYFLPQTAESSRTDWIFMGSPGYGAHLHVSESVLGHS